MARRPTVQEQIRAAEIRRKTREERERREAKRPTLQERMDAEFERRRVEDRMGALIDRRIADALTTKEPAITRRRGRPGRSADEQQAIVQYCLDHPEQTREQIAQHFYCSVETVKRILRRAGEPRKPGRKPKLGHNPEL